jgi:CubicO group peptidase (beta-lactamase class C family)
MSLSYANFRKNRSLKIPLQPPKPSTECQILPILGENYMNRKMPWMVLIGLCAGCGANADQLDNFILAKMRVGEIPGLSLAVVEGGKIVKAKGYGFTDESERTPVTPVTLFQAGSISKSVSALGALRLVEQGRLSLDADVNTELRSWKVPENEFTTSSKVTLRRILSHSAGFNVHGFPGYARSAAAPTLRQVLDGVKPANTPAIRVVMKPGDKWQYSGGGYTVMQQLIIDTTQEPFPEFMRDTVLEPLGMTNSTYEQPLPREMEGSTASGYFAHGKAVSGRWHVYPEMAAAGLWTTASDLARFAIGVQHDTVLSASMTRAVLTPQGPAGSNDGLGVFIFHNGKKFHFGHSGRNAGFDAFLAYDPEAGQGVAIMINANDNNNIVQDIAKVFAKKWGWQRFAIE